MKNGEENMVSRRTCCSCRINKTRDEFYSNKSEAGGISYECKECAKARRKRYYERNAESQRQYTKDYNKKNPDKVKAYRKEYWKNNKEEMNKNRIARLKVRRKEDPVFNLKHSLLTQLRKTVAKNTSYSTKSRLYEITGLTYEQLIEHFYSTFELRYGEDRSSIDWSKVQIDHIIPVSTASSEEEVKRLNHYTNLRLLYKKDNMDKKKSDLKKWKQGLENT